MNPIHYVSTALLACIFGFAPGALAAQVAPKVAPATSANHPSANAPFATQLAWQIALDGALFSPGILDGKWGRKCELALKAYKAAHPDAPLAVEVSQAIATYTVGAADLHEVGATLPEDWNERAKLDKMRYPSLHEMLAEKFHCTQALLARLNPGVKFESLQAGAQIHAPNLRPFPSQGPLPLPKRQTSALVSINVVEKTIRVFADAAKTKPLALFHCSVAHDKAKLPTRNTVIKNMACPPNYTFNPKDWPEIHNVTQVLTISPGPRNPVGLAWMGLDLPGYGMHGNPKPELIGKTGSHGCFRLTNWDALALFSLVRVGMAVEVVNPEQEK